LKKKLQLRVDATCATLLQLFAQQLALLQLFGNSFSNVAATICNKDTDMVQPVQRTTAHGIELSRYFLSEQYNDLS
jgi:hypothetical protein